MKWGALYKVLAAVVALSLGAAGGGVALAASHSLPGGALYPLKLALEDTRLSLARAPGTLAALNLAFAGERAQEVRVLTAQGAAPSEEVLARMAWHTEQAVAQIGRADADQAPELLEQAAEGMTLQQQVLDELEAAPGGGQGAVHRAAEAVGRAYGVANAALEGPGLGGGGVPGDQGAGWTALPAADDDDEDEKRTGLAFHPERLNVGGGCRMTYRRFVSLKNHDQDTVEGVEVRWEPVPVQGGWLQDVEISPSGEIGLGKGKPARYTVLIHVAEGWATAGPEAAIEVRLYTTGGQKESAEATLVVRNRCQGGPPDGEVEEEGSRGKPLKPPKPDNPGKGNKPDKP